MSELLRIDQQLPHFAGSAPNSETESTAQGEEVVIDPAVAAEINESGTDRLSLPPGELTLEQAQQILHTVVENRRIAARRYADSQNTTSTEEKAVRARIKRAEKKLVEKKDEVAATVAKYRPSARFPTDTELAKGVEGIQAKGTPLELLKEQVFRVHAEHHLPQLTAIVVDFVQGDAQTAERADFEDALNTGEISTINLERDELWAAIDEARRERKPMAAALSPEPEEPVTPEYAVTDFATLGVVMGRLLREYTTDPARAEDFPTDAEVAAAYEAEGLPPLRPTVLTNAVRQAQEEITEERARLARIAEREALRQAQKAAEEAPGPTAIEQAREAVFPKLIAMVRPASYEFFKLTLNRAGIALSFEEIDQLHAELLDARLQQARTHVFPALIDAQEVTRLDFERALEVAELSLDLQERDTLFTELQVARGEAVEEVAEMLPSTVVEPEQTTTTAVLETAPEAEPEPTEDDLIADIMHEYLADDIVPTLEELGARFAERGVPQAEADLAQLHGAIADMVTEEQDRVAAAAEAQRLQQETEASERAERLQEQAVAAILAARDWMHPTATTEDHGTTVQDIVAYQRITEDGDDGIDRVLADQNVFHDVLQGDQFQDLTMEQRRQVLREVGDRLRLDFKESRKKANDSYDNLSKAEDRAKKSQQTLESSRIVPPTKPAPEITDTTMYREDKTGRALAKKVDAATARAMEKTEKAAKKAGRWWDRWFTLQSPQDDAE